MNSKLTIEESLNLLAPSNSPVAKNITKKKKKQLRSPVRIPVVTPVKNELIKELDREETTQKSEEKSRNLYSRVSKKDEKNKEDESSSSEDEEENVLQVPHTPTRFKIETPRTPTRNFDAEPEEKEDMSLYNKLKDYRYTLLKYILAGDKILYVVCFDPNGQLLFVKVDRQDRVSIDEKNIIRVEQDFEDIFLDAYQSAIQERIIADVLGVVFYDGNNYLFGLRKNSGAIQNSRYTILQAGDNSKLAICQTYTVVSLRDLEDNAHLLLEATKKNYQIIQQQQLLINKNTLDNIITSVNNLSQNLKRFNGLYQKHSNNIIDDWGLLGSFASDYYQKYGEGNLSESDKDKFDKVSVNMFARFQSFNDQLMLINHLNEVIPDIDKSSQLINRIAEEIEMKDNKYNGSIIEIEELNITV